MFRLPIHKSSKKCNFCRIMPSILIIMLVLPPLIVRGYEPGDQREPTSRGGRSGNVYPSQPGEFSPLLF